LDLWLGRNSWERSTAQAALQIVEVDAQQIEGMMNESAMRCADPPEPAR
jgi:hypothetical protein